MINNLIKYFEGKKILILGFGKEGQSTYKLIRKYLKQQILYIADKEMNFQNNYEMLKDDSNLVFISGEKYLEDLKEYDIIMKTPGISFAGINTTKYLHKIKSQLELLLEFYNNFTIGVTGTKGKSTTSSLIYTVLREQNRKCMLLGNIGVPVFDYIDSIQEDILLVLEMSSHQLEYMKLSPNIAILLNVFQEHLDHYKSFENYIEAKSNIFKYQKQLDCLIYNYDNPILDKLVDNACGKVYKVSFKGKSSSNIYLKDNKIYYNEKLMYDDSKEKRNLVGNYNLNNIMFVIAVSEILKLDINKTIESINNFKTLEHRLEFVGKYNDILYYDNSIGTVPMATIEAVNALKEVDTLIIGGMNRGIDYGEFIEYLNNSDINNIICMPETGHNIAKEIKKDKRYIVDTLEEAVKVAKRVTQKEKICLLSPAAASYGFFKNFEEKGNLYKALVKE